MDKKHKLTGQERFKPADFQYHRYGAMVRAGTTLEEVLNPQYFENFIHLISLKMEIRVISDDMELNALLQVVSMTKATVKCIVLHDYSNIRPGEGGLSEEEEGEVIVRHAGPKHMWRVEHGKKIIEFGFPTKEAAEEHMAEYLKSI